MDKPEEPPANSRSVLELINLSAPSIVLGASALYVFGLYAAYRMDAMLGIGALDVSRERAVCLGIAQALLLLPAAIFWVTIKENLAKYTDEIVLERFKSGVLAAILPCVCGLVVFMIFGYLLGAAMNPILGTLIAFPIALVFLSIMFSASNARRIVYVWPLFLLVFSGYTAQAIPLVLPHSFGGIMGPEVVVTMTDRSVHRGTIVGSSADVLVIGQQSKNVAISRSEIRIIESASK